MIKPLYIFVVIFVMGNWSISATSTMGTDFWLGFTQNTGIPSLSVQVSTYSGASWTISIPRTSWTATFTLAPFSTTTINIPTNMGQADFSDVIEDKGIHIVADNPILVTAYNYSSLSVDGSLIYDTEILGNEYLILAYNGNVNPSEVLIVATADSTEVEIIPSDNTLGGKTANTPYAVVLMEGQTYQIQSYGDLSGTYITTNDSCKKIAVFAGTMCSYVPLQCPTCDMLYEQVQPTYLFSKEYITTPLKKRYMDTYRMSALDDNTNILINGEPVATLNKREFYETRLTEANVITANNPIMVAQYSEGGTCDGSGADPFMLSLSSTKQFMKGNLLFMTYSTPRISTHYLNIITKTKNIELMDLDGINIAASFSIVPGNTEYAYAVIDITAGMHTINSDSGYLAYSYGFATPDNEAESYGHSLGFTYMPEIILPEIGCKDLSVNIQGNSNKSLFWTVDYGDNSSLDTIIETNFVQLHTYSEESVYNIVLTAIDKCSYTADTFIQSIQVDDCENTLFVPNAFSPNNDYINDIFSVVEKNIKTFLLQVFDRRGQLIFETNDPYMSWDGAEYATYDNIFIYFVDITFENDEEWRHSGSLTLIR